MFNTVFSFPLLFNRLIACSLITVLLLVALKSYDSMDDELFAHSIKEREPFSYSLGDRVSDFTSRHDEVVTRSIGGIKTGMGGAGIVSSLGVGGFTAPITGGGSAVLGALGATASTAYAIDGYRQAFGPHTHNEGAKVLQSFEVPTGSFAVEKATSVATDMALTTAGITLVKSIGTVGAKVAQTRPVQDAITKVMTGGSGVTGPPTVTESLKVVKDKTGKVKGVTHTQEHHIIHQSLKEHELWKKAGMDVEDSVNKMLLPTKKGAELSTTKRSIHEGRHTDSVKKSLEKSMKKVLYQGEVGKYSQEQYKEELIKIINKEHDLLKTGHRKLNKNARPWAED